MLSQHYHFQFSQLRRIITLFGQVIEVQSSHMTFQVYVLRKIRNSTEWSKFRDQFYFMTTCRCHECLERRGQGNISWEREGTQKGKMKECSNPHFYAWSQVLKSGISENNIHSYTSLTSVRLQIGNLKYPEYREGPREKSTLKHFSWNQRAEVQAVAITQRGTWKPHSAPVCSSFI